MKADALEQLNKEVIDWRFKGFPLSSSGTTVADFVATRPALTGAGFSFPILTLESSALTHNLDTMTTYCEENDVRLAPHGKTTMAPQLHHRQLDAGAWGITAATIHQVAVYRAFGVPRILLANQLVDPGGLRWVAEELDRDPGFDFLCYADSVDGVEIMTEALRGTAGRPVPVLVEVGYLGGRTGCRTVEDAVAVAEAVGQAPRLALAGVSAYEGTIGHDTASETLDRVRGVVDLLRRTAEAALDAGWYDGAAGDFVVSAGGSAYFDIVVDELGSSWSRHGEANVVLRSGCYLTHDSGMYEDVSPFARRSLAGRRLRPALRLWTQVISQPEPGHSLLVAGRRDASFDAQLPRPELVWDRGGAKPRPAEGLTTTRLNDHHLYLEGHGIAVGDLVGFGLSHPCTAFDKWSLIPVVDDDWRVVDCVRTFF